MAVDKNELILQFKFLAQKANAGIDNTNKKVGKLRLATSGLRRSVGALRNNLLLISFAFAGTTAAISKLIGVSARFESVKTRLVGLTGSVENAEKAFDNFNRVASQTPFSLEDVVDAGAQLEAFGADSDALIGSITDLASFMGTTAVEAANAFGRAFAGGAGAADILRERGILNIIKTSQGLTDLSKTTLPEFRQALISAMQDPVVGIAGSADRLSETFQGLISNTGDSFTRLADSVGDILVPVFTPLIKKLKEGAESAEDFFREITETDLETSIRQLKEMGASIEVISKLQETKLLNNLIDLEKKQKDLNLQGVTSRDIYKQISQANENLLASQEKSNLKVGESAEHQQKILDIDTSLENLGKRLSENAQNTLTLSKEEVGLVTKRIEDLHIEKALLESKSRIIETNFDFSQNELTAGQVAIKNLSEQFTILQNIEKIRDKLFGKKEPVEAEIAPLVKPIRPEDIVPLETLDDIDSLAEGFFDEIGEDEQIFQDLVSNVMGLMKDTFQTEDEIFRERIELRKKDIQREAEAIQERARVFKNFSENLAFAVVNGQNLGDAVVNSIKAIAAEIIAQQATLALLNMFGFPGATASQAGFDLLGSAKKLFGFHEGGFIGGGGNNVPIMAQSGEFVMQRSAVQSIGLNSLSAMNETGQAGNIIININGGVVQEDYIRNELIPAINRSGVSVA